MSKPNLDELVAAALAAGPPSPEQRREQMISFEIGQFMIDHPDWSRSEVEALVRRVVANLEAAGTL